MMKHGCQFICGLNSPNDAAGSILIATDSVTDAALVNNWPTQMKQINTMINKQEILNANILIVDDKQSNVLLFGEMLREAGYQRITSTMDPHNRMKRLSLLASLGFVVLLSLAQIDAAVAATAPPLGAVQRFGVLGATGVTAANPIVVTGDVGSSPTSSITGSITVDPAFTLHTTNDSAVQQAQIDATAAVSAITPQTCTQDLTGLDLGTVGTLTPGVYCFTSGAGLTGTLTLNGSGVYIFKIGTTLTTAGASIIALSNGADSGNVFWQVGSAANLGASSTFRGTIFAGTSISLGTSANLVGRAVAQTGAVTLDTNTVTVPLPSITIVKSVVASSDPVNATTNPKAIPGSEMLYTITVTNNGYGSVDNNTTVVTDPIPANTELFVGDISGVGSGPVLFTNGATASGLSYSFINLANAADNLSFSNDSATSYGYSPAADANQCDATVTHLRISLGGIFSASDGTNHPSFSVKFRVRVK